MSYFKRFFFLVAFLVGSSAFFTSGMAEWEIKVDAANKTVYLISGAVSVSVGNAESYFSGSLAGFNSGDVVDLNTGNTVKFSGSVLKELQSGTELEKAVYWMYENGLTMYNTVETYRPQDLVTREESAKLVGQLFETLGFEQVDKGFNCAFTDTEQFDPTLAAHIAKVCKWGIFRGNDKTQEYMPHEHLTKGQILAVLTRILEGKLSNENSNPWWIEYYVKMKQIGITNETSLERIDLSLTREEIALLIYRFKNLIVNADGTSSLEKIKSQLSGDFDTLLQQLLTQRKLAHTGSGDTSGLDLDLIVGGTSLANDPEFNEAIRWMYDAGITDYNMSDTYMPFQTLTREQVAKMLDKFAIATNLNVVRNTSTCTFSDVASTSEFSSFITHVCQYGVMNGTNGKFFPQQVVTKAEFIAMLMRLFEGKALDENVFPWWKNYYDKAIELRLISAQDTVTFSAPIARYEVATFLYRLKVRLTMYTNLNDTKIADEIVRMLEDTTSSGASKKSGKTYVDVLALNNSAFKEGYVEVFDERYKVKKSEMTTYNVGDNSFVWYGDLIDLATDKYVGTITFIMTNGALTEGVIRFSTTKQSYYFSKDTITTTWYWLKEV